jgi:TatD DNase family protein
VEAGRKKDSEAAEAGMPITADLPPLVDSHAHLDMPEFDPDREDVLRRAWTSGLVAILCPADLTRPGSVSTILELRKNHPSVMAAAGVHAHQAGEMTQDCIRELRQLAAIGAIRAIGEIGLDYHYNFSPPERQREVLRMQLAVGRELNLPVILHSRLSGSDIIAAVDAERFAAGGILHCFTEDEGTARAMIDRGFLVSFSGILTFPNAHDLREVAKKLPLDRLLVETDCPYLAPVPMRGRVKRNEPAFVAETAKALAHLRGLPSDELAEVTTRNFASLFPIEKTGRQC